MILNTHPHPHKVTHCSRNNAKCQDDGPTHEPPWYELLCPTMHCSKPLNHHCKDVMELSPRSASKTSGGHYSVVHMATAHPSESWSPSFRGPGLHPSESWSPSFRGSGLPPSEDLFYLLQRSWSTILQRIWSTSFRGPGLPSFRGPGLPPSEDLVYLLQRTWSIDGYRWLLIFSAAAGIRLWSSCRELSLLVLSAAWFVFAAEVLRWSLTSPDANCSSCFSLHSHKKAPFLLPRMHWERCAADRRPHVLPRGTQVTFSSPNRNVNPNKHVCLLSEDNF